MSDDATGGRAADALVRAVAAAVTYFGAGALLVPFVRLPPASEPSARVEAQVLVMAGASLAVLALAAWWPPAVAGFRRGFARGTLLGYLALLAVWLPFTAFAYPWLLDLLGQELAPQATVRYFAERPAHPWIVLLGACVLAPIAEEVLFRGYLLALLRQVLPTGAAVLAAAALFGLIHGLLYAVPVAMLGALFGILRVRYRCLAAPILAHALHNGLTVGALYALPPEVLDTLHMR